MKVEAINMGRRPVILTRLGGYYADGHWSGIYIGKHNKGYQLGENEKFSEDITEMHPMFFDHERGVAIIDLWFEDTLGRRYRVKNARKHIRQLIKQNDA